jgi:DNA-binding NarL/FixJ family response regulator
MSRHSRIRLLLVDDQELFREALRIILSLDERFEVVGEASHGAAAIDMATSLPVDVILMDIRMPGISGIEATRRILMAKPEIRILVVTTFDTDQDVLAAMRAGAAGYVMKDLASAELKKAIECVANGECYLPPSVAGCVVTAYQRLARSISDPGESELIALLSPREKDILRHLAQGQSNKEIASSLGVAEGTIKNHLTSIFAKFQAPDRTTVALKARQLGLG